MKDYRNYRPSAKRSMLWSEEKMFQHQVESEGKDIIIIDPHTNIEISTRAIIRQHGNPLNELQEDRKVMCHNDYIIKRGFYIRTVEDNRIFLIITEIKDDIVHQIARMVECNNTIKWQDEGLVVREYPCIISDKTSVYSDGVFENKHLTLGDDQVMISTPNIPAISEISRDKRLIFNHDKDCIYKTTRADKLTQKGLLSIRATHQQYDKNVDNLETNISNGVVASEAPTDPEIPTDPTTPMPDSFTISIAGADTILTNASQTYTAIVKNNGVIDTNQTVAWELDNIDAKGVTIESQTGTSCTLRKNSGFGEAYLKASLGVDVTIFIEKKIIAG